MFRGGAKAPDGRPGTTSTRAPAAHITICQVQIDGMPNSQPDGSFGMPNRVLPITAPGPNAKTNHRMVRIQASGASRRRFAGRAAYLRRTAWNSILRARSSLVTSETSTATVMLTMMPQPAAWIVSRPSAPGLDAEPDHADRIGRGDRHQAGDQAGRHALAGQERPPADGDQGRPHLEAIGHGESTEKHQSGGAGGGDHQGQDDDDQNAQPPDELLGPVVGTGHQEPSEQVAREHAARRRHIGRGGRFHGRQGTHRQQPDQPGCGGHRSD